MATIALIIIALVFFAVYYLPVYLPLLMSFFFTTTRQRKLRTALRIAPLFAILILTARPRTQRPIFGDDVAGDMRGAEYYLAHEFWPDLVWTWSAGISGLLLALLIGFIANRRTGHAGVYPCDGSTD